MRRSLFVVGALLLAAGGACFVLKKRGYHFPVFTPPPGDAPSIANTAPPKAAPVPTAPLLSGIDLTQLAIDDEGASAPAAAGRVALLTVDPELERVASALFLAHRIPEAAVVMIDTATGRVIAYASHHQSAPHRDLCAEANAPAASLFKIVTGAALVEHAGLSPDTRQCYTGGEQRISASDLVEDPQRDRWCTTLAGAMGRSINTVFARLAQKHLRPQDLEDAAKGFGFGEAGPLDLPVEASTLKLPSEPLAFARTAAGFWNTTLSPVEAAFMSASVARGGEAMRPFVVQEVRAADKSTIYTAPAPSPARRAVSRDVAQALTTMMERTVSEGTSFKAFRDPMGRPFLPGVAVAGKTGTLTDGQEQRFFTWFTGFAPSRPIAGVRQVAIAVLVVNGPSWHVKANVVAREMLRAYFAGQKVPSVSRPVVAIAREERPERDDTKPRGHTRGGRAAL